MKQGVLIFIDWYLPGYKAGGPVSSVANIVASFRRDFDFYIVTRNKDYQENKPYEGIPSDEWVEKESYLKVYYFSDEAFSKQKLQEVARSANCSIWYMNGVYSWRFSVLPLMLAKQEEDKRVIIAPRGMLSRQGLGVKRLKKSLFLTAAKMKGLYKQVFFHATSAQEKIDIQKIVRGANVSVASNLAKPVNLNPYKFVYKEREELRMISIARIAKEKNTMFALEVLLAWSKSKFYKEDYLIEYDLYGQMYDERYWNKCQLLIDRLPLNISVNYKGNVPPGDIPKVLADAQLFFLPTTGENFGHAILEAMANERPVLISDRTPWTDLREKNVGWDIPLDDVEEYVKVIQAFLYMDQSSYARMCSSAMMYARGIIEDEETKKAHKAIFTG